MSIQSLGVGSGLALDDLVTQLIDAERKPKQDRLDKKDEALDAQISGLGQLKSKMSDFLDAVEELKSNFNLQGREPTIDNPSESVDPFTAEASNSAVQGTYEIAVTQIASGSRIQTADADFASGSSVVSAAGGSLEFKVGATGDSFNVAVSAGMTLQALRDKINANTDNFGVSASIIDTGTAAGAKLVYTSSITGAGNDLIVVNTSDDADLQKVSTTDSTEALTYLSPVKDAKNAKATIDGIDVESENNVFESTISNVSFTVKEVSTLASDNVTYQTSTLTIGNDTEGLEKKIRDFVDTYNALNTEIKNLSKYGTSDLEDDGALAGDFMVRSIQQGMSSIIGGAVSSSALGGLFKLGIEFNDDNELEISAIDKYGFGSGTDRLADALENNYDDIAALFTDENEGIAKNLYDYVKSYTTFSGLLTTRERAVKDQKDSLADERESFELRMIGFEETLRKKYLNLDQTIAKLNQSSSALIASLGGA
jgi:flagellar hook-associated protein 2